MRDFLYEIFVDQRSETSFFRNLRDAFTDLRFALVERRHHVGVSQRRKVSVHVGKGDGIGRQEAVSTGETIGADVAKGDWKHVFAKQRDDPAYWSSKRNICPSPVHAALPVDRTECTFEDLRKQLFGVSSLVVNGHADVGAFRCFDAL